MSITREDVERVARLASLGISEAELPALTAQMARILDHVSQVGAAVDAAELDAGATWLGTEAPLPLRPDDLRPPNLARPLKSFAPALKDGLFLVPRLAAMEDE